MVNLDKKNSRKCELCDKHLKNKLQLKKHLNTHSYKPANYKCQEREFVGERHETMDVHIGQHHTDNYECVLFHLFANRFEKMETHVKTADAVFVKNQEKQKKNKLGLNWVKLSSS